MGPRQPINQRIEQKPGENNPRIQVYQDPSSPKIPLSSVYGVSYYIILLNAFIMAFFPLPLMAKMVEKSNINPKRTRYTKLYLVLIQILSSVLLLLAFLYSMRGSSVHRIIYFALAYLGVTALNTFLLLVINAICNSFIEETEKVQKLSEVRSLITESYQLVCRLRSIKTAFNPLLFIMLPLNVVLSLVLLYTCYFYLVDAQYLEFINKFCILVGIALNVFYYTHFCNITHQALSNNNDKLR